MKLVYSKSRGNQADIVHRFDVLGDLLPSDLDVMKNSLTLFFEQLRQSGNICPPSCPIVILDLSECTLKVNESKLQIFASHLKTHALACQVFLTIAQSDIESMHAEQKAIEQSLLNQIHLLESKISLVESVKSRIQEVETENQNLREKIDERKSAKPEGKARSFFEKLWGES